MMVVIMEEDAWLNALIVEAKLRTLGKAGRWPAAQTERVKGLS
jgi:hypothetical protein